MCQSVSEGVKSLPYSRQVVKLCSARQQGSWVLDEPRTWALDARALDVTTGHLSRALDATRVLDARYAYAGTRSGARQLYSTEPHNVT